MLDIIVRLGQEHGDIVSCPSSYGHSYLLNRPDLVRRFLTDKRYVRARLLKVALGESSLGADGEPWRRQRRVIQPIFHPDRLRGFALLMRQETLAMLAEWDAAIEAGSPLDVDEQMMRLTLVIVVKALFSVDIGDRVSEIADALTLVIADLGALTATMWGVPIRFTPERNRRFHGALQVLDDIVYGIIESRRGSGADIERDDLLAMLLAARDEHGGTALDDRRVRDEVVTMLVAGHETTATMLSWCWTALAQHPEVEAAWHEEIDRVLGQRAIEVDDMEAMPYTRKLIQETLRLYPPVWLIARMLDAPDEIDGYTLEARRAAFVSPYMMHRHPDHWEAPERFDPERFCPAQVDARPRYAWVPFGGGPHLCAGMHFAMMEGHMILPTIAQRVSLALVPDHPIAPEPFITLRHRHGLKMVARRRGGAGGG